MNRLPGKVSIQVNPRLYLKNPESSDLGQRIVNHSIDMIYEFGFEGFTFRKLARRIGSTEASIYRYFENKHKLLLYLISWYWLWMEYRLLFKLANISSAEERLQRAINTLTEVVEADGSFGHIDETRLQGIVIAESSKAYLTKEVDEENQIGAFSGYKQLVDRVSQIILEIAPGYKYPQMLVSTIVEGGHHQRYFAQHLPRLTNVVDGEDAVSSFYTEMVLKALR